VFEISPSAYNVQWPYYILPKFLQQNSRVSCDAKYVALSHAGKGKYRHVLEWNFGQTMF